MLLGALSGVLLAVLISAAGAATTGIEILSPAPEDTIHDNSGSLTVVVRVDLSAGEKVRLLLDEIPAGVDTASNVLMLENIDRGAHTVRAQVIGSGGTVVADSRGVIFYMWQASSLFPGRAVPAPRRK